MDRLSSCVEAAGYDASSLISALRVWFELNQIPTYRCPDIWEATSLLEADQLTQVPTWIATTMSICDVLDIKPNNLLGFDDKFAVGWHPYPVTCPNEGQRVVIRRTVGNITRCGEYIYRDGDWYEPGLEDFMMNITGVTHWIESPEV